MGVRIDLDALMAFPVEEVERVLAATRRGSRRKRKLPAHVMVYYVIALGLLASVGAREVLRRVLHREEQEFRSRWRRMLPSPSRGNVWVGLR